LYTNHKSLKPLEENGMLEKKLAFSRSVIETVRRVCKTVFNLQSDADVVRMFGINEVQMENVINNIVDSLPDAIFEEMSLQLLEEIKYITAREYIFFQVQEKWDDPQYKEDLERFTHVFSRDIQRRIQSHQKFQVTTKEEK